MRKLMLLAVLMSSSCLSATAENTTAVKGMSDAERARAKAQVEELTKSKLQAGAATGQAAADAARRQTEALQQKEKAIHEQIDKKTAEWSYVIGPDAAKKAAEAKRQQLQSMSDAEKAKIAKEAADKAARAEAAARKNAENIKQTVEGLKSQVGTKGQYGLQPKGSNLYVRQYGK